MNPSVLLVNDEPATAWSIRRTLRDEAIDILHTATAREARALLDDRTVDVVICDQRLPDEAGRQFLEWVSREHPDSVRVAIAGQKDLQGAVDAFNSDIIFRFIVKPWANQTLRLVVHDAIGKARESSIDARSGWLTYRAFCHHLSALLDSRPVKVIVAEIRNATTVWSMLDRDQRLKLAGKIVDRCAAVAGEPLVPHASLERGLFAFAVDAENNEHSLAGVFDRLRAPFALDHTAVTLQLDFGIAVSTTGETDAAVLVRRAMEALTTLAPQALQREGIWTPDSGSSLHQQHSLERDMTRAMARNEFFVQIQPQVSTRDFRITGGETLIRWRHPEHGLVSPLQFIDLAERNGFINEIGLWITNKAVQTLETMFETMPGTMGSSGAAGLRLSFNVSPRQFLGAQTSGWAMLLRDCAMDNPHLLSRLEMEITESTIIHDQTLAHTLLREFKEMGLRIALDDFGTGYSSLSQIMELPLDVLKLDRSLIRDIERNPRSRIMVTHLTRMAHDLGLEIVAEGVESSAQTDLCRELGCDLIQGYAFHHPLDVPSFLAAIAAERARSQPH